MRPTHDINEWGIPLSLPSADQLPTLVEAPVAAASTAYVVDGIPVVTDAESGDARLVFDRDPTPDWYDSGGPGRPAIANQLVDVSWSQAVLSPDGQWLVLVQALKDRDGELSSQTFLMHIPTATPTFLRELATAPDNVGPGTDHAFANRVGPAVGWFRVRVRKHHDDRGCRRAGW